jgi:hypothetical protein
MAVCAAFRKESRMKIVNATNFDRKSGVAQWRGLRFLSRFSRKLVNPTLFKVYGKTKVVP